MRCQIVERVVNIDFCDVVVRFVDYEEGFFL